MENNQIETLKTAIIEIRDLAETLPGGVDYEADPNCETPDNAIAHVGGLIWKICNRVLKTVSTVN